MERILCPRCEGTPVVIEIDPAERATACPSCGRRLRIRTLRVIEFGADYRPGGYLYRILGEEENGSRALERISSADALAIKPGRTITTVRRGSAVEGLADQSSETWIPVTPAAPRFPALRRLALALAWPVTILAAIQTLGFWQQTADLLRGDPLEAGLLAGLVFLLALVPVFWWLLRTMFPEGPRRKSLIPGWRAPDIED